MQQWRELRRKRDLQISRELTKFIVAGAYPSLSVFESLADRRAASDVPSIPSRLSTGAGIEPADAFGLAGRVTGVPRPWRKAPRSRKVDPRRRPRAQRRPAGRPRIKASTITRGSDALFTIKGIQGKTSAQLDAMGLACPCKRCREMRRRELRFEDWRRSTNSGWSHEVALGRRKCRSRCP
jgi:hypothetical protein